MCAKSKIVKPLTKKETIKMYRSFSFISGGFPTSLMIAQNKKCFYCGKEFDRTVLGRASRDHFFPKHRGYQSLNGNMVFACVKCNSIKSNKWPTPDLIERAVALYQSIAAPFIYRRNTIGNSI